MSNKQNGSAGLDLYQTVTLVGFMVGFSFVFLICLKAFILGESSFFALIFQIILASFVGAFTGLIGSALVAPIVVMMALLDKMKR